MKKKMEVLPMNVKKMATLILLIIDFTFFDKRIPHS